MTTPNPAEPPPEPRRFFLGERVRHPEWGGGVIRHWDKWCNIKFDSGVLGVWEFETDEYLALAPETAARMIPYGDSRP